MSSQKHQVPIPSTSHGPWGGRLATVPGHWLCSAPWAMPRLLCKRRLHSTLALSPNRKHHPLHIGLIPMSTVVPGMGKGDQHRYWCAQLILWNRYFWGPPHPYQEGPGSESLARPRKASLTVLGKEHPVALPLAALLQTSSPPASSHSSRPRPSWPRSLLYTSQAAPEMPLICSVLCLIFFSSSQFLITLSHYP